MEVKEIQGKVKALEGSSLEVTTKDAQGQRRISGYANKPTVDRTNDVVEVKAFHDTMARFMNNPIMLLMHNSNQPIGTWDRYELRSDGLWVSGVIATGTKAAEEAWALIEQQVLRSLSIGFRELDGGYSDNEGDSAYHITKLDLLEVSVVSVPANADAVFTVDKSGAVQSIKLLGESRRPTKEEAKSLAVSVSSGVDPNTQLDSVTVTVTEEAETPDESTQSSADITTTKELVEEALAHIWGISAKIDLKENSNEIESLRSEIKTIKSQLLEFETALVKLVKWEAQRLAENAGITGQ